MFVCEGVMSVVNTTSTCVSQLMKAMTKDLVTSPEVEISTARPSQDDNDALFYIITVLLFYACSIVILMVKYIRRERQEAEIRNYYYEYVSREQFRQPQYQNFANMRRFMKSFMKGKSKILPPHPSPIENKDNSYKDQTGDTVNTTDVNQKIIYETPV